MINILRPILELSVVIPGLLLAYFPVKSGLKQPPGKLALWQGPLVLSLCIGGGMFCWHFHIKTVTVLILIVLIVVILYIKVLRISIWKSGTIALSVCALFACMNSLARAVNAVILIQRQAVQPQPWFCLWACVFYHGICWLATAAAYYPADHAARTMVEDDNFARTWYVFWILPLIFIVCNFFMIPRYKDTLYVGRVLQGYIVLGITLLILLICFYTVFLMMAASLNKNARLQRENQLLDMQQQRYENLKTAIEEARQARHDMRHHLNRISALAEGGDLEGLKTYLAQTVSRIPDLDMSFCENRAADSVIGYYCSLAKRENIPFCLQIDLPEKLTVDEIDMCLVFSNLLENALEASLRTAPDHRQIEVTAYVHGERLLLIEVKNAFDGVIKEKNEVFQSSKRKGSGIGIQSVRHIARKNGGASAFSYKDGIFSAKVMLRG